MSFEDFFRDLDNPRVRGFEELPMFMIKERPMTESIQNNQDKIYLFDKVNANNGLMAKILQGERNIPGFFDEIGIHTDEKGLYVLSSEGWNPKIPKQLIPYKYRVKIKPFIGDLLPESSWGSNLINLIKKSQWNDISEKIFQEYSNRCEMCGTEGKLELHEKWRYLPPINNDENYLDEQGLYCGHRIGVQRLSKLMPLCKECHTINHLDYLNDDDLEISFSRIQSLTRLSAEDTVEYYKFIMDRQEFHNHFQWVLDLGYLNEYIDDYLAVAPGWAKYSNQNYLIPSTKELYNPKSHIPLRILEIKYSLGGYPSEANDSMPYYCYPD